MNPIELVLSKFDRQKRVRNGWLVRCPVHRDGDPSLSIGESENGTVLLKCMAGCDTAQVVEAIGLTMADLFPPRPRVEREEDRHHSLHLRELSDGKGLDLGYVTEMLGWRETTLRGHTAVEMPYRTRDGSRARTRIRIALTGKRRFMWASGEDPVVAYEPDLGEMAARQCRLVIVEGETDVATLLYAEIPALGIPGATSTSLLQGYHVDGVSKVYISHEIDAAGDVFVRDVKARLAALGYSGEVFDLRMPGAAKDPNTLWQRDRHEFPKLVLSLAEPMIDASEASTDAIEPYARDGVTLGTDTAAAEMMLANYGSDIVYAHGSGWHVWNGRSWHRQKSDPGTESDQVSVLVRDMARRINLWADNAKEKELSAAEAKLTLASKEGDDAAVRKAERDKKDVARKFRDFDDWTRRMLGDVGARSVVSCARPLRAVPLDTLDKHSSLLSCSNGTVDMRTGALAPHRREDLVTKEIACAYEPHARSELWDGFLARVLPDPDVREYVHRFLGYGATGESSESVFAFAHGAGANGKSVLTNVVARALGSYAKRMSIATLTSRQRDNAANSDLADLRGVRLALSTEPPAGFTLNEELIKDITGGTGEAVKARHLRRDYVEFEPTHTLWMSGNHKPTIRGTDPGIWRRVVLVPFTVEIPKPERDKTLVDKLTSPAHLPAVLSWLVSGAAAWYRDGLPDVPAIMEATANLAEECDSVAEFIRDQCNVVSDARNRGSIKVKSSELHREYQRWCEAQGLKHMQLRSRDLTPRVIRLGFEHKRDNRGSWFLGLSLQTEPQESVDL